MAQNPPANAEDAGSIPGSGRSPGEGNGNPLRYSYVENSTDRRAWWMDYSLRGRNTVGHDLATKQEEQGQCNTDHALFQDGARRDLKKTKTVKTRVCKHAGTAPLTGGLFLTRILFRETPEKSSSISSARSCL